MTFSLARGGIFFLIGLPIAFVLTALVLATFGRALSAAQIAPFAVVIAALPGLGAAVWDLES